MAYPLIFYAVLMLLALNAKYEFLRIRLYDSNRSIIVEDPSELKSFRSHNPNHGCQVTQLDQKCIVTCQDTTIQTVESGLNQLDYSVCQKSLMELVLRKISFTNSSIKRGWLLGSAKNITKLEIYSSTELSDMEDAAFAAPPFTELEVLIMDDIEINNLMENTFLGASIAYLELRFRRPKCLNIEAGILIPLASSLSSFQLSNGICESQAIKNLTGTGKNVLKLQVLDLRYNNLEAIEDESFIDVSSLVSLYLSGSGIKFIGEKAFSGLGRSVRMLTISNNNIQTLKAGVFNGFDISGQIKISGNPWRCNCSLEWMKYFYTEKMASYFDNGTEPFLCQEEGVFKNYTEVDFCPTSSTSIEITTPTIATNNSTTIYTTVIDNVTTIIPSPTMNVISDSTPILISSTPANIISCRIFQDKLESSTLKLHLFSETTETNKSKVIYYFENIDETPFYKLRIENAMPNEVLLWINSHNHEKYGCISDIHDTIIKLVALEYMQTYFLCLLTDGEATLNPFDCTTLVVPPEWGSRTWIPNRLKHAVIGGTVAVTLIAILAIIIGLLMIKKRPRLVRTHRKYMLHQDFLLDKTPPSLYSMSDGYLSPNMYERINYSTCKNRSRCQNRELPPPPPSRSRKFGGKTRFSVECSGVHRSGELIKPISRSFRDCAWRRKQPFYNASRSKSIPSGERICPLFEF